MQEALKREFITQYLDEDGLCNLEDQKGFQNCRNDNGILFAIYGYILLDQKGLLDGADFLRFYHTVTTLTVEPGLYNRRPNDFTPEAHDNRDAIACGSVIFDQTFARDLCNYGERMGWQYANQDTSVFSWKQMAQGGNIAFTKICAGRIPYIVEWVWLLVGMAITCYKSNPSTRNLTWMRRHAINKAFTRYSTSTWMPFTLSWLILKPIFQHFSPPDFLNYFGPNHVITRMSVVE